MTESVSSAQERSSLVKEVEPECRTPLTILLLLIQGPFRYPHVEPQRQHDYIRVIVIWPGLPTGMLSLTRVEGSTPTLCVSIRKTE